MKKNNINRFTYIDEDQKYLCHQKYILGDMLYIYDLRKKKILRALETSALLALEESRKNK